MHNIKIDIVIILYLSYTMLQYVLMSTVCNKTQAGLKQQGLYCRGLSTFAGSYVCLVSCLDWNDSSLS